MMTKKTLRRLPPTVKEIAKALNEIHHGFRVIDRLLGPEEPKKGLINLPEMEIMAQAMRSHMPKINRSKKGQVDAIACPSHGTRLHPSCTECVKAWEANSQTALAIQGIDKAFGE